MQEQEYEKVRKTAVALVSSESRDTRSLAVAVLAVVPANPSRGGGTNPPRAGENALTDQLTELATRLEADGVTTPHGDPYTVSALANLRETAMAWEGNWQDQAAYRTHQEAGSPNTDAGKALIALCAIARGENANRPNGLDPKNWQVAKAKVKSCSTDKKWLVSANILRLAMGRRPNVPGRTISQNEVVAAVAADPVIAEEAAKAAITTHKDMAEKVLADPDAGRAVRSYQTQQARKDNEEAEANTDQVLKMSDTKAWHRKHYWNALTHLDSARYQLMQALEEFKICDQLNPEEQEEAGRVNHRVFQMYEWVESFIRTGDKSFEDQLAKLMEEGQV